MLLTCLAVLLVPQVHQSFAYDQSLVALRHIPENVTSTLIPFKLRTTRLGLLSNQLGQYQKSLSCSDQLLSTKATLKEFNSIFEDLVNKDNSSVDPF
jgi:hypothetical protein